MRKIRSVLKCHFDQQLSARQISLRLNISRRTIANYLTRYQLSLLQWPLAVDVSDDELETKLFPKLEKSGESSSTEINYSIVHEESKKKGFTLQQMHQELVLEIGPDARPSYSTFCRQYNEYKKSLRLSLRQTKILGEICMVDYAGKTMQITDSETGIARDVQIFVGMLAASNYTFVEATETQRIHDWIGSHTRMFEFFDGVPELVIHDNLKSAVTKPNLYAPLINESYKAFCDHYEIHPMAARVYKPKDKAGVELAVQIVTRWILFALRKQKFFSLAQLNSEITRLLTEMNRRPFKQLPGSRYSNWSEKEQPILRKLPQQKYEFAIYGKARAGEDYHVHINNHFYSVPHRYRNTEFIYRLTTDTVELLQKGKRITSHKRSFVSGEKTTDKSHQPPQHRAFDGWSAQLSIEWASEIGINTEELVRRQLDKLPNKHFGHQSLGALKKIEKEFGRERLDGACKYALACGLIKIEGLKTILSRNLDSTFLPDLPKNSERLSKSTAEHENLRGSNYYEKIVNAQIVGGELC